jgi:hypothetical protein
MRFEVLVAVTVKITVVPSDTYRESITSITAVLFPFVTYSLTLPRILPFIRMRVSG